MSNFKIGSKIVEMGKVYTVFKITKTKMKNGNERVIHYKSHFKTQTDNSMVCSIPECSIEYPDMRKPVSRNKINEIMKFLSVRTRGHDELDVVEAKTQLKRNDILKTAEVIKKCFKEQKVKGSDFSKTKKDLLKMSIERIVEEIALVYSVSTNKARQKVTAALGDS